MPRIPDSLKTCAINFPFLDPRSGCPYPVWKGPKCAAHWSCAHPLAGDMERCPKEKGERVLSVRLRHIGRVPFGTAFADEVLVELGG